MNKFKKVLSISLALFMVFSLIGCTAEEPRNSKYIPGTYTGTATGMAELEVEVTVDENLILEIEILRHDESAGISDSALESIPQTIIDNQSLGIDGVTGATITSNAILEAVASALKKAGANIEELSKPIEKVEQSAKEDIIKDTDIVIIGGGGSGLTAALSAVEQDAKVIVIEKMPMIGGNTMRAEGTYNSADPERQEPQGIEDSPEKHFQDTYVGGDEKGDKDLIKVMTDNSLAGIKWLESHGFKFKNEVFTAIGGIWERGHAVDVPAGANIHGGSAYIEVLSEKAESKGAEIMVNTKAEKLIMKDGRVSGVEAIQTDGTKVILNASKAVIIATGGFSANAELASQYDSRITPTMKTSTAPGSTGDGIFIAEEIGAGTVGMEYIQVHPLGDPKTGSVSGFVGNWFGVENYVMINKEGERFVSESERRDVIANAILEQTDDFMYLLVDSTAITEDRLEQVQSLVAEGATIEANSIEELAAKLDIESSVLQETIDKYNAAVEDKNDVEFGKKLFNGKFEKAPFYASVRVPTIHHTMGGLKIDTSTHVLDTNGEIIPGLYAAGEVAGGIHGGNRLGGNAFPDIVVFGRISGENAALGK